MEVYKAIVAVQTDLCKEGLAKDGEAKGFGAGYKFRGIDALYNVLSPLLAKHNLVIIPRCMERVESIRASGAKKLYFVMVRMEFDFISAIDGSKHTAITYGEAMDSGDKATNKAMSIAYKYACFQAFAIPTEGDNDPDATIHAPMPQGNSGKNQTRSNGQQNNRSNSQNNGNNQNQPQNESHMDVKPIITDIRSADDGQLESIINFIKENQNNISQFDKDLLKGEIHNRKNQMAQTNAIQG